MSVTAQEPYLLDPDTLDPVPLYDPRYRRRRSYSYDPRRRRKSRARRGGRRRRFMRLRRYRARAVGYLRRYYTGRRHPRTIMAKINKSAGKIAFPGALGVSFLATVGPGDMQSSGATGWNKVKVAFASAITRVSGGTINAFSAMGVSTSQPVTAYASPLNMNKVLNNWVWGGLAAYIYSHIPFALPFKSVARKAGKGAIIGGALGGLVSSLTGDPAVANPANTAGRGQPLPLPSSSMSAGNRGRYQ